ncbi:hypothetical protein [uncultured Chryseobacterium sp.]|uniref:hypothetical protein n=1 Tax=uncultured Chryseobacterium sp. TaxID=259322 RepID=UPI0025EAB828|nr:hypothetical protein [uncultured Chryseobacterium sp.]
MKGRLFYFLPLVFIVFGCEDKKLQHNQKIDLFADERQEGKAYIMKPQECFYESDLVVSSADIKLVDQSSGRGKPIFIYRVLSGKVLKTTRDSVVSFPFQFLSGQRLMFKRDSTSYIYLKKLEGYRFIAKPMHLKYRWLKAAPVYSVKSEQ